ncbi:serine hydrolase [Streptomyces turgidiscabies]|uniref:Beta-lactamase n=1 Tax=Streptomyces turgidiscabies (strain Car8) TaxID=698760 RepID=L7F7L9_STRT8|nr:MULTISPECIES: serine hydrolase [Streptomyces]ELP67041.1 beta-lactamase [Streptomyces turgidiscabies Car8]MDX3496000.1 serine hydrolase [Streptomyces turgidiscabies]GAQ72511.1 D-alanyl-D-alanine-carboxypeptidase/ endopeptidase AmpH precursor [Streptomyces turgidiscabies]
MSPLDEIPTQTQIPAPAHAQANASASARRLRVAAALGVVAALAGSGCTTGADTSGAVRKVAAEASPLPTVPPAQPPPSLTRAKVDAAVDKLDGVVRDAMSETGVPGVAVGVVYDDKVLYLKGFGVRKVGAEGKVGPDTVFQLASVSKPVASTVVAAAVGEKKVGWDDPVVKYSPGFALKDPWVTRHATLADLFSHRTGLPDHSGDILEDLGYDRSYILERLRYEPLTPFRASYAYTNFGLTEAGVAVARAAGTSWEKLSADKLYRPLGMDSTSSSFADYEKAKNKAVTHVKQGGTWQAKFVRDADAQSPAGGASSTVRDMTKWLRLQLGNGEFEGRRVVDADALDETHLPHSLSEPPHAPAGRSGFYGLGWNVSYDDHGRLKLGHSGGFAMGAATNVALLPSENLGIVVLTNGAPVGVPESISATFLDTVQTGGPTVDWLTFLGPLIEGALAGERSETDYAKPPAKPAQARADDAYTGTYANDFYGPMTVSSAQGDDLVMQLGPKKQRFTLRHYDGDTFYYSTTGENAVGLSGVTFTVGSDGRADKVRVENFDTSGLGTFTRQ